jgi:hypothetical protein
MYNEYFASFLIICDDFAKVSVSFKRKRPHKDQTCICSKELTIAKLLLNEQSKYGWIYDNCFQEDGSYRYCLSCIQSVFGGKHKFSIVLINIPY